MLRSISKKEVKSRVFSFSNVYDINDKKIVYEIKKITLKLQAMKNLFKNPTAVFLTALLTLSLWASAISAHGIPMFKQVPFTIIKGTIVDSKTNKPLEFVTITAIGTNVGTVSNKEGKFTLKLNDSLNVHQIAFSQIGYINTIKSLSDFTGDETVVKLEATAVVLDAVTVRPNDAYMIVENMMRKTSENYSQTPNAMMAFYRETVKQRKRYVSISEALVDIYKASYVDDFKEDETRLNKARKSSDVKKQDTIVFKLQGGPDGILLMDIIKNPYVLFSDDKINNYLFNIDEVTSVDGKINYTVSFKQKTFVEQALYFGKLFIDVKSNALTAAEFSLNIADKNKAAALFIRKKPLGLKITPENTNYIVKYSEKDGKYYFNYARNEVTFKVNWNKRLFNSYYTIMSEIAITDRSENNVAEFSRKERLGTNIVFSEKINACCDDNFWGEYNIIQPEESIDIAIKKYGKRLMKTESEK